MDFQDVHGNGCGSQNPAIPKPSLLVTHLVFNGPTRKTPHVIKNRCTPANTVGDVKNVQNLLINNFALNHKIRIGQRNLGITHHQSLNEVAVGNTVQEVVYVRKNLRT